MSNRKLTIDQIYSKRSDLSTFLVHLTRDHEDGTSAKTSLEEILNSKRLIAKSPSSLFSVLLQNNENFNGEESRENFESFLKCICFTETPLDQIKNFIGVNLARGDIKELIYSEYGLVYTQEFVLRNRGNPCFYVATHGNNYLKKSFLNLFGRNEWHQFFNNSSPDSSLNILPFVNIFGKDGKGDPIDYYWEREWRIPSSEVKFEEKDIIFGMCPETEIEDYSKKFPAIKFISVHWSLNKIIDSITHSHD